MGLREVKRRTPGGRVTILYKKKRSKPHKCAICGATLHGLPRCHPRDLSRLNKTQKKVFRPYGGNLCHKCVERLMIKKARNFLNSSNN